MSWKDAKAEAKRWIDQQQIPRIARGGSWDLTEPARRLKWAGDFRTMVLEAARRLLKTRDIHLVIRDEPEAK